MRWPTPPPAVADALKLAWLPLLSLLLAWGFSTTAWHGVVSDIVDDAMLQTVAQPSAFEDVAVIDFDDLSLRRLQPRIGPWPYRREVFATLLEFLRESGARVIVFDILFSEPREGDAAFARALQKGQDVVLAAAATAVPFERSQAALAAIAHSSLPSQGRSAVARWPSMTLPTPELSAALEGVGAIGIITTGIDADGQLRRLPLLHEIGDRIVPSLLLSALLRNGAAANGLDAGDRPWSQAQWPSAVPTTIRLALPANPAEVPKFPAETVLDAALGAGDAGAIRAALKGRTVFIGSSAFLGDRAQTARGPLTGLSVLANAYSALNHGEMIRPASAWQRAGLLALALLPCLLVARRGRPVWPRDAAWAGLALLVIVIAGLAMLRSSGTLAPVLTALGVVAVGFALTAVLQSRCNVRANRALREQRLVAESANAAKSEFLAGVSHELRTPLHAVLGMADALSQTELTVEQRRYVEVFRTAGSTLGSLIDDLLDLSRIEAGEMGLEAQVFSLASLVETQQRLLEPRASAKGLFLRWQREEAAGDRVVGDPKRLAQVLVNLVGNAIKFTSQGGVSVTLGRTPAGLLHVHVQDTGIGIEGSKLERIFEPFVQADRSVARRFGGTGLGLSISRRLAGLMGGRLWVESEQGAGSTFHFTADLPTSTEATDPSPATGPAPGLDASRGALILLVEDDEVNVLVAQAMLANSPHRLDVAADGESGIEMFRACRYDVVLMDVHMPGIDGYTAARALRAIEADESRMPTAVYTLSASAFESDRALSLAAGCTGHLTKPLGRQQLLEALARHSL